MSALINAHMEDEQLDLFSSAEVRPERLQRVTSPQMTDLRPAASAWDDQALVAAIPDADLADAVVLASEAGKRRLAAAVPALAALCRRFAGFGESRMVPEQAA